MSSKFRLFLRRVVWLGSVVCLLLQCGFASLPGYAQDPPANPENSQEKPSVNGEPVLRASSNLVTVNVSVSDGWGRFVAGLDARNFEVYEDGVRQKVEFFNSHTVPISVGIIFDVSGSMRNYLKNSKESLRKFIDSCQEDDEFFLISFNSKAQLLCDFTRDSEKIASAAAMTQGKGQTALFDAIRAGMEKIRQGRHTRKALIIITDGQENDSRCSYGELRRLVKETDVKIYAPGCPPLREFVQLTGGSDFGDRPMDEVLTQIAIELRMQYNMGYYLAENPHDNRWHDIRVKLHPPRGMPPLSVRTRKGYFSQSPNKP